MSGEPHIVRFRWVEVIGYVARHTVDTSIQFVLRETTKRAWLLMRKIIHDNQFRG